MHDMDFDLSGCDSECERNEGFWSESDGELSDNIVAGGEVQAAGNEIRPEQFESKQDKQRKLAMKFPVFMMIGRTSKEDLAITTGYTKSYS